MSVYDDKLFEFLTKSENFEPLVDMYSQFGPIKERLLLEFWTLVKLEIEKMQAGKWKAWIDDNAPNGNAKVGFYHPTYTTNDGNTSSCLIIFEKLSGTVTYGLWFHRNESVQKIDFDAICKDVRESLPNWTAGSGGWWFAAYKQPGEDFSNPGHLSRILPEVRDALVKEYAGHLASSLKELEPFAFKYGNILSNR